MLARGARSSKLSNLAAALLQLEQGNVLPDSTIFADLLRECGESRAAAEGKRVHDQIIATGLGKERYVENLVIEMYGKCGSLCEARGVFDGMGERRNIFSWNIMITAYAQNGHTLEAVLLFKLMQLVGVRANCITFMSLMKACGVVDEQHHRAHLRQLLACYKLEHSTATGTALLNMHGRWGDVEEARRVFDAMVELCNRDTITWNAMISAYAHNHHPLEAIGLFRRMLLQGIRCNHVSFLSLLDAFSSGLNSLSNAKLLHLLVVDAGYSGHPFISNCLVNMYARCGSLDDARHIFDTSENKEDVISWNTIISAYSQHHLTHHQALELFCTMLAQGPEPDRVTFLAVLEACDTLEQGRRLHSLLLERKIKADLKLQTVIINMYSRCGSMHDAAAAFQGIGVKDVVCWNSLVAGYAHNGDGKEAMRVLKTMDLLGYKANKLSFMAALEACASTANLTEGRRLHQRLISCGSGADITACSALVNMYGRCKSLADARRVFEGSPERNVVTWTAFIGALVDNERYKEATVCFRLMEHEGVRPNEVTLVCTIDACSNGQALALGLMLHRRACECGMDSNVIVGNSLINMYGKCGRAKEAKSVFDSVQERDLITWNALMSAFGQNGQGNKAVETYCFVMLEGVKPDRVTFVSVLDACATSGSLLHGQAIHQHLAEAGFECVDMVAGSLVNMYGRCGSAGDAKLMFDRMQRKNAVAWNAVAGALAQSGHGREALKLLGAMEPEGVKPDLVTFITLLDICADCNALAEGKQYHARVEAGGFSSDVVVGNALLNMYGKCGGLTEARAVFAKMPEKNSVSWNTMIVAYSQNGHVKSTIALFREMDSEGILPNHVSFISILFACSHGGLLDEGRRHFQYMTGDHGILPTAEHYGCFVDLLARNGRLVEAEELVSSMPVAARSLDWAMLLGSSAVQANTEWAEKAINQMSRLESEGPSPYVGRFNMHAARLNKQPHL